MKDKRDLSRMFKEAGILFAITLLAGLILGFVNELTREPIAYQQELKIQKACTAVFEDAASFEELTASAAQKSSIETVTASASEKGVSYGTVYRALSADGSLLGYVLNVTSSEGYGGDIELMLGVTLEGTLNGISLLSISETPGLGMEAGDVLVPQFAGKQVSSFTYTKTGASADNEIDAISGATITTRAVTNAVNAGLGYFNTVLKEGGEQ